MNEEIKQLTELQVIDLQISRLDEEIETKQIQVSKLEQASEERKTAIMELKEKMEAADRRRQELENEHADEIAHLKDRQSKMMQVQTNREYQSLLKEIEDGKRANKEREEEIVRLLEQTESFAKIMKEQIQSAESEEKILVEETRKADSHAAELSGKKAAIAKERDAMIEGFSPSLLKKYDMLRERRNGRAVVGVVNGVCQGCFMNIPPQQYNELLRGDRMLFCPTCQRILYHQPEDREE